MLSIKPFHLRLNTIYDATWIATVGRKRQYLSKEAVPSRAKMTANLKQISTSRKLGDFPFRHRL